MKPKTLRKLINLIQDATNSTPSEMSIHIGCDCGCGGNMYTYHSWDQEHQYIEEARKELLEFCKKHNIEIDVEFPY